MRAVMKFDVVGYTLSEINEQASKQVAKFLELGADTDLNDVAEIEVSIAQEEKIYPMYTATVSVRIR